MRSLRGRLVAILLLVALGGMIVLAAVTFAAQRSFLYDKLDRQLASSFVPAAGQLAYAAQTGTHTCSGTVLRNPLEGDPARPPSSDAPPDTSQPPFSVPPGTYAAIVERDGQVAAECLFGFRTTESKEIPDFAAAGLGRSPLTIGARGGDGTEFRAAARPLRGGERIVIAVPLNDTMQTINRLVLVEIIVIVLGLALLGLAAWLLVGIGLRPLDRMGRTADEIAGGDLARRVEPADSRSEIGRLGLALNGMLQRLERAFSERRRSEHRLRQFLADASHELRTPLVSIRGYAELYRLGVTPDSTEVRRSMERIEQEAERMGLLVEDMLTLARLDETHDRDFQEVDLSAIAADAVRDAEVSAPDRCFEMTTGPNVRVLGDAHQLQQVIANLVRNATVHTPGGTPVEISITKSDGEVRLDVRDHGPGLPEDADAQIFERFWRAEGGRERGKAGSGLGLAIVSEIVTAHDGRVEAGNATDGGAVFSVWLPAA